MYPKRSSMDVVWFLGFIIMLSAAHGSSAVLRSLAKLKRLNAARGRNNELYRSALMNAKRMQPTVNPFLNLPLPQPVRCRSGVNGVNPLWKQALDTIKGPIT